MISNTLPLSLTDNPILSQWIAFEPGKVRIATGKVEIGQGILTAMTQIAAEELDVRPDQIRLVSGETDVSPAEYFTSGSYSVAVGGAAIRLVCAEVRSMFLDKAAEALGCKPASFRSRTENSCAAARTPGATTGRWPATSTSSAARAAPRRSRARPSTRSSASSLPRLDLPAKVEGAGFIHDIAVDGVRARPRAAPALARRAARGARRGSGAQGRRRRRSRFSARASSSPSPATASWR